MENSNPLKFFNDPIIKTYLARIDQELVKQLNGSFSFDNFFHSESKKLRPALAVAICLSTGTKPDNRLIKACAAIECLHIASLIHDDIIDESRVRWSMPTLHKSYGLEYAVLAGDYLFAKACDLASSLGPDIIQPIAEAYVNMCQGQMLEFSDKFNQARTVKSYLRAINLKTAFLIKISCQIGATCAGLSKTHNRAFMKFGESFGMTYQLVDDLLDFLSTEEMLKKPVGVDLKEGVYTLPVLHFLATDQNKAKKLIDKKPNLININQILIRSGSFKAATKTIRKYNTEAKNSIKIMSKKYDLEFLTDLGSRYFNWALTTKVNAEYQSRIL